MDAETAITNYSIWHGSWIHKRWDQLHCRLSVKGTCSQRYHQVTNLASELITAHARCTQDRIDRLWQSTTKDDTLALLKHTVQHGWPQTITELPPELCPYWTFRKEISIEDGILLKGERMIIPAVDQPDILQQLHHGHLGLQSTYIMYKSLYIGPTSWNIWRSW